MSEVFVLVVKVDGELHIEGVYTTRELALSDMADSYLGISNIALGENEVISMRDLDLIDDGFIIRCQKLKG